LKKVSLDNDADFIEKKMEKLSVDDQSKEGKDGDKGNKGEPSDEQEVNEEGNESLPGNECMLLLRTKSLVIYIKVLRLDLHITMFVVIMLFFLK
jgi:hypothetical protein